MDIKKISLFILFSLNYFSFSQTIIGFGGNTGITGMFTTIVESDSPKNTFKSTPTIQLGHWSANVFIQFKKNNLRYSFSTNNFFFNATDNVIPFFIPNNKSKGQFFNSGVKAFNFQLSYGRVFKRQKISLIPHVTIEFNKYRFGSFIGGMHLSYFDDNDNLIGDYSFKQKGSLNNLNNSIGFGVGASLEFIYHVSKMFFLNSELGIYKGLNKIANAKYQTTFDSNIEPIGLHVYNNTLETRGSNFIWSIGCGFQLNKK